MKLKYEKEMITERDYYNMLNTAKADGLAEGEAKGREEGLMEGEAKGRKEGRAEGRNEARIIPRLLFHTQPGGLPVAGKLLKMVQG